MGWGERHGSGGAVLVLVLVDVVIGGSRHANGCESHATPMPALATAAATNAARRARIFFFASSSFTDCSIRCP